MSRLAHVALVKHVALSELMGSLVALVELVALVKHVALSELMGSLVALVLPSMSQHVALS